MIANDVHATSTFVGCSPTAVKPGQATTCTATVSDAGPGAATTPTGTVSFSSGGAGNLSRGGQCDLGASRGSASCAVSFTPGRTQSGTPTLTARYGGDFGHTGSSGSTTVAPVAGVTANVAVLHGIVLISLPRHAATCGRGGWADILLLRAAQGRETRSRSVPRSMRPTARDAGDRGRLPRCARSATPDPDRDLQCGGLHDRADDGPAAEKRSHRKATGMPATNLRLVTPIATTATSRCRAKGSPGRAILRELSARAKGFFPRDRRSQRDDRPQRPVDGRGPMRQARCRRHQARQGHRHVPVAPSPCQQGRKGRWRAARQAALPRAAATDRCKGDPAPAGRLTRLEGYRRL